MDKHITFLKKELEKKQNEINRIKSLGIADVETKQTIKEKMESEDSK